jgi:transcription factor STE12
MQQSFLTIRQPCSVSCPSRSLNKHFLTITFRHRRTHEPRQDGEPLYDEDELEGEDDHLHSLEEESPESGNDYMMSNIPASISDIPGPMSMGVSMGPPQHMIAAHNY